MTPARHQATDAPSAPATDHESRIAEIMALHASVTRRCTILDTYHRLIREGHVDAADRVLAWEDERTD